MGVFGTTTSPEKFPKVKKGRIQMKRISLLALVFAFATVVFLLLLIFFRIPFGLYPLMSYQDALDILTPLVLIPLYWLLFQSAAGRSASRGEELAFIILSAVWVLGHGMHLAANSIDNLIENMAKQGAVDVTGTGIYQLTYFFDEHLSHYTWHIGILGLAALIIYREWRQPAGVKTVWWASGLASFLYGITLFLIFLEGQTVPLGLPAVTIFAVLALIWGRKRMAQQPVLAFFAIACGLAVVLFAGWGLYWGGFPQLSDVGLI
jgi:hypothetical protein